MGTQQENNEQYQLSKEYHTLNSKKSTIYQFLETLVNGIIMTFNHMKGSKITCEYEK